ncbi:hypothetical protein ACFW5S_09280 [Streptomyces olivaceus]|uniref:hypothetical protein n=1 Tax=Streptomyces olivaceus TaxID=47716 RepID=UPI003678870C
MSLTRSRFAKHTTALALCLAAAGTVLAATGPAQAASGRHHDGHTGAIECRGQGTYPDAVVRRRRLVAGGGAAIRLRRSRH